MTRSSTAIRVLATGLGLLIASAAAAQQDRLAALARGADRPSNIIVIMADDLGSAELGCTGSDLIRTPNIDRLREEGMLFTQGYSGACVCAPSRCSQVTGLHMGHAQIRDNGEIPNFDGLYGGQRGVLPGTETIGRVLRNNGYKTAAVGKWGLGGPNPDEIHGHPLYQGFGFWYGYLCQRNAHNYYPYYVWRNFEKIDLDGNNRSLEGEQYVPDLMADETLAWMEQNAGDPLAGDCNQANGTPACSDAACCVGVCDIDAFCCEVEWDAACVNLASGVPDC